MNALEDNPSEEEMRELAGDGKKAASRLEASGQSEEAKALQEIAEQLEDAAAAVQDAKVKREVLEGQEASM